MRQSLFYTKLLRCALFTKNRIWDLGWLGAGWKFRNHTEIENVWFVFRKNWKHHNVLSKLIDLYFLLRFISKKSKDACKHAFSLFLSYFDNFLIKCHSIIWICQKPKMSKLGTRVLVYNSLPENKCNRKISKQFYIISTVLLFCTLWLFWLKRGM